MNVANFWRRQSLSPIQSVLAFVTPKHKQNADNCIITRCPIADSVPKVLLYTECDCVLIAVRCLSSHPKSMICRVFKLSNKFYLGVFQLSVRISSKIAASTELVRLRYGAVSVGRHCTFHAASFLHAPHSRYLKREHSSFIPTTKPRRKQKLWHFERGQWHWYFY